MMDQYQQPMMGQQQLQPTVDVVAIQNATPNVNQPGPSMNTSAEY